MLIYLSCGVSYNSLFLLDLLKNPDRVIPPDVRFTPLPPLVDIPKQGRYFISTMPVFTGAINMP